MNADERWCRVAWERSPIETFENSTRKVIVARRGFLLRYYRSWRTLTRLSCRLCDFHSYANRSSSSQDYSVSWKILLRERVIFNEVADLESKSSVRFWIMDNFASDTIIISAARTSAKNCWQELLEIWNSIRKSNGLSLITCLSINGLIIVSDNNRHARRARFSCTNRSTGAANTNFHVNGNFSVTHGILARTAFQSYLIKLTRYFSQSEVDLIVTRTCDSVSDTRSNPKFDITYNAHYNLQSRFQISSSVCPCLMLKCSTRESSSFLIAHNLEFW